MMEKKFRIVAVIITSVHALICAGLIFGTAMLPLFDHIALLIVDSIFLLILISNLTKKRYKPAFICSIVFTAVFAANLLFWAMLNLPLTVSTKWQYPYAVKYGYGTMVNRGNYFLPEELPGCAKDVHYEFLPTILQGSGHQCVGFTADDDYVEELEDRLEDDAMFVIKYSGLDELNASLPSEESDYGGMKYISLYTGTFTEDHPDATVYIIYTNYNWNHPRSKAVFIDGNSVFFSQE